MKKLQQESIYLESSTLYANWLGEELKFSAICTRYLLIWCQNEKINHSYVNVVMAMMKYRKITTYLYT